MGVVPVIAVAVTLPMLMIGVIVLTAAQHAGACLVPPATTLVGVVPEVILPWLPTSVPCRSNCSINEAVMDSSCHTSQQQLCHSTCL